MATIKTKEQWTQVAEDLNKNGHLNEIYLNIYGHDLKDGENPVEMGDSWDVQWALFQKMWEAAPDSPHIHSWDGWSDLCDLCSEKWVFEE